PRRPPSSDRAWNTTLTAAQGDAQSWISDLTWQTDARSSFNELVDTPFRFDERLMSLETSFFEYRQTNPFVDAVSAIPDEQRNLYKALVEAYDADKAILDTYGESTILKRRREDDDQEGPSAGLDRGSKRQKEGEEPVQTTCQMEEPLHPVLETVAQGDAQLWISDLARQTDARSSFNELLDTPIDFSNFIMNWLNVDTLTPELLVGPTYELMRGSCNSLTELEYHLEEVYKATTDQLDWVNPEGQQYPHNLLQPLPLILDNRGHRVIPFDHFINNDLEYLRGDGSGDQQQSLPHDRLRTSGGRKTENVGGQTRSPPRKDCFRLSDRLSTVLTLGHHLDGSGDQQQSLPHDRLRTSGGRKTENVGGQTRSPPRKD
nr:hypothetical protein [Tanacetum cinerariifolium]